MLKFLKNLFKKKPQQLPIKPSGHKFMLAYLPAFSSSDIVVYRNGEALLPDEFKVKENILEIDETVSLTTADSLRAIYIFKDLAERNNQVYQHLEPYPV